MIGDNVMAALGRRIPLTLLCDLVDPAGPHSRQIYGIESADAWARALFCAEDDELPTPLSA